MTALLVVCALAGVVVWLAASPVRLVVAGLALGVAHPALTFGLIAAAAVVVVTTGVVIVWRALAESGWLLIAVQHGPACAPAGVRHG
jgi:hypothetical protein